MFSDFLLIMVTLAFTYFGATWIKRDKHRERNDALLDALNDAVDTITDLEAQVAAIIRHPSQRHLHAVDGAR